MSSKRVLGHYSPVARPGRGHDSTTKEALWKRVGIYSVAVLVVGTVLLLLTTLFLAYLWFGDEQQWVWRRLVETQWLTRTVTLIALFVRLIISMQAAAATSMIAAVFLESHTNLPELASVSIMRFTNTGPSTAIYPILRTAWASPLMATVLVALALTSTALQFTSTVLLSDFDTVAALTVNSTEQVQVTMDKDATQTLADSQLKRYWSFPPGTFTTFAELEGRKYAQESEAVVDTGITIRGFLPLTSQETRTTLENYVGYTSLLDMRVACIRPVLDNVTFMQMKDLTKGSQQDNVTYLTGYMGASENVPLIAHPLPNNTVKFTCMTNQYEDENTVGFGLPSYSLCTIHRVRAGTNLYTPGLYSPLHNNTEPGRTWVLIDHTNVTAAAYGENNTWTTETDGVWMRLVRDGKGKYESSPRLTMCLENRIYKNGTRIISSHGFGIRTEPQVTSLNSTLGTFNTTSVLRQLTATNHTLAARNLLNLTGLTITPSDHLLITPLPFSPTLPPSTLNDPLSFNNAFNAATFSTTTLICTDCLVDASTSIYNVDPRQKALFLDTLTTSNNPARALQAYFATNTQLVYYDMLPFFNVPAPATVTRARAASVPTQTKGFAIVTAVTWCHVALVAGCVAAFAGRTRASLLGNAWQVVAQAEVVVRDEVVRGAVGRADGAVEAELKGRGRRGEAWVLAAAGAGEEDGGGAGRVVLRRKTQGVVVGGGGSKTGGSSAVSLQPLVREGTRPWGHVAEGS